MIKTFEEARALIRALQICTIFESEKSGLPSLWEHVDLPEKQEGEKGWGEKISAVWDWKNRLPATFPDEIFYGKIKGGFAVLMTMDHLRHTHFPAAYKPVSQLNSLAGHVFEKIRNEPWETTELRKEIMAAQGCSKSQFDTALKNLQISLNVVRSNDPAIERDTWLTFQELYPEIWELHVVED
ncbi:AlkZ-related protein [Candidatus Leptofilum sp.]|uniref:AlkZ-related protein n=1 Tax=Candidatus Leptofilum sp. TaxID=3241576 RepID=UPI003B59F1D4